jgi:hypothetical protein
MATKKIAIKPQEGRQFGEGGLSLDRLTVHFFAAAPMSNWLTLIGKLPFDVEEEAGRTMPSVSLSLVTVPWTPRSPMLYIEAHDCGHKSKAGKQEAHWTIRWRRSPESKPPARLLKKSEAVGPHAKVMEILSRHWPGPREIELEVSARYTVDPKQNALVEKIEKSKPEPVRLGHVPKQFLIPLSSGWVLTDGKKYEEVTIRYPIGEHAHHVDWSSTMTGQLSAKLLRTLDKEICKTLLQITPPR